MFLIQYESEKDRNLLQKLSTSDVNNLRANAAQTKSSIYTESSCYANHLYYAFTQSTHWVAKLAQYFSELKKYMTKKRWRIIIMAINEWEMMINGIVTYSVTTLAAKFCCGLDGGKRFQYKFVSTKHTWV